MTPEEMAEIDRQLANMERGVALLQEIEGIQRDMDSLDELTPEKLDVYVASLDMWNDGSDPVSRMIRALRRLDELNEEMEQ
jgi:hypothetical protein